jgi:two-component system response regulator TtrR
MIPDRELRFVRKVFRMSDRPVIYIVDDDAVVCDFTRRAIDAPEYELRCYAAGQEFLDDYDPTCVGCLVTDLHMPGMTGQQILEKLKERRAPLPAIMISGNGTIPAAVQALNFGAIEFLEKPCRVETLREAVRKAIPKAHELLRNAAEETARVEKLAQLTPEELATMQMIVDGKPDKAIAGRLDISIRTVQFRRASLMKKLGVKTRAALICLASSAVVEPAGCAD